ncbi:MAG: hypothetical protein PW845_20085 [Pseudomonas sp.]|nr:hypothetical protein [Pseudomonas sp. PIA16]MDE1167606.1 hypothetical protein [Pseudomonas sp.]
MKYLLALTLVLSCTGCKYFSYQDSCTDNPDQSSCAGVGHP